MSIFAKPNNCLAGVASPASLLIHIGCVVATKFTTSNNYSDEASLYLYVYYTASIHVCKESVYCGDNSSLCEKSAYLHFSACHLTFFIYTLDVHLHYWSGAADCHPFPSVCKKYHRHPGLPSSYRSAHHPH